MLIYPFPRSKLTAPFVALPNQPTVVLFSLLRWASSADPAVAAVAAKNREIFAGMRAIGEQRCSIGNVLLSHLDWVGHFRLKWPFYLAEKLIHDPLNTLTPGQHISSW